MEAIQRFATKQAARAAVWQRLVDADLARPPLPIRDRIPNFADAEAAARRLFEHEPWRSARCLKINPDSPQAPVRREALLRGIVVYVPTPRLAGGFHRLDPARIARADVEAASHMSTVARFAEPVALGELPQMDAIVTGCVCVTLDGRRCGKGAGYSDIEYAILHELGHTPVPVATTVHEVQIVDDFPVSPDDLPLSLIVTAERAWSVAVRPREPRGLDWSRLGDDSIRDMPVLGELRRLLAVRREAEGRP